MKYILFFVVLISNCTTTSDDNVVGFVHTNPLNEKDYADELKKNSKYIELYSTFETTFFVNTSYFSEKFLSAFNKRKNSIFNEDMKFVENSEDSLIFLVSIFGPDDSLTDLSDNYQWLISLEIGDKKYKPSKIKKLQKEHAWGVFFHYINQWSNEYLIYFPKVDINTKEKLIIDDKKKMIFTLANSQAKTKIRW